MDMGEQTEHMSAGVGAPMKVQCLLPCLLSHVCPLKNQHALSNLELRLSWVPAAWRGDKHGSRQWTDMGAHMGEQT